MDMESGKQQFITSVKKYQYIILIVLIGIFLMLFPSKSKTPETLIPVQEPTAQNLQTELAAILSHISGVGKTQVLLAEAAGSNTIYQMDTGQNQSHADTVIIMDGNREETGLVKQILPPVYRGAVIACQGADSANVRLAIVEAVKSVTGLSSDRITVLKMN